MRKTNVMRTFDLYWSPEGRKIATVQARNSLSAVRKAPKPYSKYKGEIYAIAVKNDSEVLPDSN